MLKELLLFIKYPYTAGIIAVIWISTAILLALTDNQKLEIIHALGINLIITVIIAFFGFRDKKE